MIAFRNTIIAVVVISLFTFIALFGRLPALRKTPIGFSHRLLCIYVPNGFRRLDARYTGGRMSRSIARLTHYLFQEKNPLVLLLFLTLLTGSATLFLKAALPHLETKFILPIPIVLLAPYTFTYLCVTSTVDHITPANHAAAMRTYPYDHILFRPENVCRTCNLVKPARSKHCSLCGVCVARCDHHCAWVNNCVGRHNYRWFLLVLLSIGIVEIYGAYLCWHILSPHLHLGNSKHGWLEKEYWAELGNAFVFAMSIGGIGISGVGLLAVTTLPLPFALFGYHVYLIWAGMTTNESAKWADWRDDMTDGVAWIGKKSVVDAYNQERKARQLRSRNRASGIKNDDLASESEEEEEYVPWPRISDQVLVSTTDGKAPTGQEHLWEKATSLDMVENIYDLGFWRNFIAVWQGK
ncbi:zf-DHHC-domain-containing protein [Aureobasidium pullulans]|uniref:Palmitoyltransferase n=1 Tax=Aureobasidium pullulans TaxID=5580 RepID=A0A4S9CH54_AURPU|nr:zf-DHHC-domain-containing protein [Aureobasidium pullulans]